MPLTQYHPRQFGDFRYVYPVISRRSGGLSLGINLSPSGLCNFSCVYCQILAETEGQKSKPLSDAVQIPHIQIPLDCLESELRRLIESVNKGTLFEQTWLVSAPPEKRVLKDIAFSGDGEPTLAPQFAEAVQLAADLRKELCADSVKIVLITNASTLHLPAIRSALNLLLYNNGEIWAKLDAGSPEFFQTVSRSSISFQKIRSNLVGFAQELPVVIQTCFLALHGQGPSSDEVQRYAECLNALNKVLRVQIYTTARNTPVDWAAPLDQLQLDEISESVRKQTGLEVQTFYSR